MTNLASLDGTLGPADDLRIPVTDEGLLRGDGAFEVMRLYGGRPFALSDHDVRLRHTCEGLRLEADHDALAGELDALLEAAGPVDALLRVVLTRGGRRIAIVEPLPQRPPVARVATITYAPNRILDGLKTLSYAGNMLAGRLAKEQGYDEGLFVTPHGRVLEGPTWTFFWVHERHALHAAARGPHPRLDHARAAARGVRGQRAPVHARRRARGRGGVHRLHRARGDADRRRRRDRAAVGARARDARRARPLPGAASSASWPRRRPPRRSGALARPDRVRCRPSAS